MEKITQMLNQKADGKFADFQARLIPTVDRDMIIGVRTPDIRAISKILLNDRQFCDCELPIFLKELPHRYLEENLLHGDLIGREKDYDRAIRLVEEFLPHVDNWAVCDMLDPKIFKKHKAKLLERIKIWLSSNRVYTVRFGIDMMIKHFLDDEFEPAHLELVRSACTDDYYIKMAKAWYFSFALIKHYDETLDYLKAAPIDAWTFKKSIQKARESYRISEEHKAQLKEILKHD